MAENGRGVGRGERVVSGSKCHHLLLVIAPSIRRSVGLEDLPAYAGNSGHGFTKEGAQC